LNELERLPWQAKTALIAVVVAACVALLPEVIAALGAAGVVITADIAAEAVAALAAGLAARFGIPVPG